MRVILQKELIYRNTNEFRASLFNPDRQPLYLSDFKSIEVTAQPSGCPATIKCTFVNGEESLAEINPWMLQTLQTYLYSKAKAANDDETIIPKRYEDIYVCIALIILPLSLFILFRH